MIYNLLSMDIVSNSNLTSEQQINDLLKINFVDRLMVANVDNLGFVGLNEITNKNSKKFDSDCISQIEKQLKYCFDDQSAKEILRNTVCISIYSRKDFNSEFKLIEILRPKKQ